MEVEFGVHELDEVIERQELGSHAGLVAEEVALLGDVSFLGTQYG